MTEIPTIKKIRNKANAKKIKEMNREDFKKRMGGLVIPVPFDVYLEKIQGIPHNMVGREKKPHSRLIPKRERRKYETSTIQDNQMALGDIQVQASEYHCQDNTLNK